MINLKIIYKVFGNLLILEVLLLLLCVGVGIWYKESNLGTFIWPAVTTFLMAIGLKYAGRHAENRMGRRDGYLIVSMCWVVFSLVGMLPFLIGGYTPRIAAAFFESMSGFTTTGATILNGIDHLPHSILFWRSLMHWLGGMGIVFFTIAVLPQMGSGDLKLFSAEATGLKIGKMHPRISTTARWLWGIYMFLTVSCSLAYYLAGMNLFDAVNHGMSTISTGGFSTHQDSIAYFQSPLIEYISILFMLCGGINFTLLYLLLVKRRWREVLRDGELRCFLLIIAFVVVYSTGVLVFLHGYGLEEAFRRVAFTTISLQTTTGFTTVDFMAWHPSIWMLLLFVTICGSCAGSTSGGVKCIRILTAFKMLKNEFRHILHPRAVLPIRLNHSVMNNTVGQTIFAFFIAFVLIIFCSTLTLATMGMPLLDSLGISVSAFSNAGPSLGWQLTPLDSWAKLSDGALWVTSFLMLAGRLEIFSILLPFIPAFWKEN